jgi:hypothetical protein
MKIETVGVKISRKVDLGYLPYKEYLKSLGSRPVPFGTRDNSNIELDVYLGAKLEEGEVAEEVANDLLIRAKAILEANMTEITGVTFEQPQEAYVIEKTEIKREYSEI